MVNGSNDPDPACCDHGRLCLLQGRQPTKKGRARNKRTLPLVTQSILVDSLISGSVEAAYYFPIKIPALSFFFAGQFSRSDVLILRDQTA